MHDKSIRSAVLNACREFMKPLARLMVRCGVSYKEFAQIAKEVFVDVVSVDYGIRGRQTNISRVAVLTGLTRKEVSRIRRSRRIATEVLAPPRCRPEQVLEAWHRLDDYKDSNGATLAIPAEGDTPSFSMLVRSVGGDIPYGAMLKELVRAGSVEECANHTYRAISKTFMPDVTDPESILIAGEAIHDLAETISSNLFQTNRDEKMLERRVYSDQLGSQEAKRFRKVAEERAKELLEELDDLIAANETWAPDGKSRKKQVRVGLGIYLFEDHIDK